MRVATDWTRPAERPRRIFFHSSGRELVAHDAVQHPAGLLGVHKVYVYVPGLLDALGDDFFGDLVEGHAAGLVVRQVQQLLQVPGDGLALAVRVGGEIHGVRRLRSLLQIGDNVGPVLDGMYLGSKPCSTSTPRVLLGRSRRWPMEATTL
jgi:hypothetical protein